MSHDLHSDKILPPVLKADSDVTVLTRCVSRSHAMREIIDTPFLKNNVYLNLLYQLALPL